MPVANIDDKGTKVFYTDSGPVLDSPVYLTLFLYHGTAFNGDVFRKLLPLAASKGIRLVTPNRRQYRGSSEHTESQMEDLRNSRDSFIASLALDTANFVAWFIKNHDLPRFDGKSGGCALMGWSFGIVSIYPILGNPDTIPHETIETLERYLHTIVIYDSPHSAFGLEHPPVYDPDLDTNFATPAERIHNFSLWVSSYYDHTDIESGSLDGLDLRRHGSKPTIIDRMSPEELADIFQGDSATHSDLGAFPYVDFVQPLNARQAQKAFWDEKMAAEVLPGVKIVHLVCDKAVWKCILGYSGMRNEYESLIRLGKKLRPMRFEAMKGANHFPHWDEPGRFLDVLAHDIFYL